jgi:division/cell wall cluster transcriptional repressor MraZ
MRHGIDGKNRITIPSGWRRKGDEEDEIFLMPSATGQCLTILPSAVINDIRAKAAALPGAQRTLALRRIGSQCRRVSIDKHGRLSLPDEFCKALNLSGTVTLVGVVETFEIWNSAVWETAKTEQKAASDQILTDLGL